MDPAIEQPSEATTGGHRMELAATPADDETQHPAKPKPLSLPLSPPELRWDVSSDSTSCCDAVKEKAGQGVADAPAQEAEARSAYESPGVRAPSSSSGGDGVFEWDFEADEATVSARGGLLTDKHWQVV